MIEAQAFIDDILENPLDDAPRLVYADWLEERGDQRAEFIRLQCEIALGTCKDPSIATCGGAGTEDVPPEPCGRCSHCLRVRRADELLRTDNRHKCTRPAFTGDAVLSCAEWNPKHPSRNDWCDECRPNVYKWTGPLGNLSPMADNYAHAMWTREPSPWIRCRLERGFVSWVEGRANDLMGERCGCRVPSGARIYHNDVCSMCRGNLRIGGYARPLMEHPLTRVSFTDKRPLAVCYRNETWSAAELFAEGTPNCWMLCGSGYAMDLSRTWTVDNDLFEELIGGSFLLRVSGQLPTRIYSSRDESLDDLSFAYLQWRKRRRDVVPRFPCTMRTFRAAERLWVGDVVEAVTLGTVRRVQSSKPVGVVSERRGTEVTVVDLRQSI